MLESLRQITYITISSPQLTSVPIEGDFISAVAAELPVGSYTTDNMSSNRSVEPVDILVSTANAVLGSTCSTSCLLELLSMQSVFVDVTFTMSATLGSHRNILSSDTQSSTTNLSAKENEKRHHLAIRRFLTDFGEDNIVSAWVDAIKRIVFVPLIINRDPTAVKHYIRQSLALGSSPYLLNTDHLLSTLNIYPQQHDNDCNSGTTGEKPEENNESVSKLKRNSTLTNSLTTKYDLLKDESILIGVKERCLFSSEIPVGADPLTPPVEGAVIDERNTADSCTSSLDLIDNIVSGRQPSPSVTFRISFTVPDICNRNMSKSETQPVLLALACTMLNPEAVVMTVQSSDVVTTSSLCRLMQTNGLSKHDNKRLSQLPSAYVASNVLPLGSLTFGTIYIESSITKPLEVSSSSKYIGPNHILLNCKVTAKSYSRQVGSDTLTNRLNAIVSEKKTNNKRRLINISSVSLDIPSSWIGSSLGSLLTRVRHDPHQRVGTPHEHANLIKVLSNAIEVIPVVLPPSNSTEKKMVSLLEGEAYSYVFFVKLKPEFAYLAEYAGRLRHSYLESVTMKDDNFGGDHSAQRGHMLSRGDDGNMVIPVSDPETHFLDPKLSSTAYRRCNLIGDAYRTGGGHNNPAVSIAPLLVQSRIPSSVVPNQHIGKIGLGTEVHALNIQHKDMAEIQQKLQRDIMTECEGLGCQQGNLGDKSYVPMDSEGIQNTSLRCHERTQSTTSYIYNNGTLKVISNIVYPLNNDSADITLDLDSTMGSPIHSRTTSHMADLYCSIGQMSITGVAEGQKGRNDVDKGGNLHTSHTHSTERTLLDCLLKDVINTSFIVSYEVQEMESDQSEHSCSEHYNNNNNNSKMSPMSKGSHSQELRIEQKVEWSFCRDYYVNLQNKKHHISSLHRKNMNVK